MRSLIERAARRSGFDRMALSRISDRLRILCYHGIWAAPGPHFGDKLFMSPEVFEARLRLMRAQRIEVLPMAEALAALRAGRLPARAAVITIDDGWATTFSHMLPMLEQYGYPATVYVQTERLQARVPICDVALRYAVENTRVPLLLVPAHSGSKEERSLTSLPLGDADQRAAAFAVLDHQCALMPLNRQHQFVRDVFEVAELDLSTLEGANAFALGTEEELVDAHSRGFEMALHTHTHGLGDFSAECISDEIFQNRAALASMLGVAPESFRHFCWPSGEYTEGAIGYLRDLGIDIATSCNFGLADARSPMLALPRILDGQSMSNDAFLFAMSGAKSWVQAALGRVPRPTATGVVGGGARTTGR